MKKRIIAALLVVVMLINFAPAYAAEQPSNMTRGETADILLQAAGDYNPGIKRSDIIRGDEDGNLRENDGVTRAEAFVMISRAFGELPMPVGANVLNAYDAANFTDISGWAVSELANIFSVGIVAGTGATTFSPDEYVTDEQLNLMIDRIYTLKASNLKDNFYAAVNKKALDESIIVPGYLGSSSFTDLSVTVDMQVAEIIQSIASGTAVTGGEKKIKTLYNNILDVDARNKTGIAPLKPYLEAIDKVSTLSELMDVQADIRKELGTSLLIGFSLTIDKKESTKRMLDFSTLSPTLGQSGYSTATESQKNAYLKMLTTVLTLGGETPEKAAADAQTIWDIEAEIATHSLPIQDANNVDKTYNVFTMDELQAIFPNIDLGKLFAITGLKQTDRILVTDVGALNASAALCDDAHIEELKTIMRTSLLSNLGALLNEDFMKASLDFQSEYMGISIGAIPNEYIATQNVQAMLSDYLGEAYCSRYCSPEAKADVEDMVKDIIAVYKDRIKSLTWMSETTKEKAIKKLETMGVKIGYPDEWEKELDDITFRSTSEGGSFFENVTSVSKNAKLHLPEYQFEEIEKDGWTFTPYTINACYNGTQNAIEFPAGILQAPFYDINASREENLGHIGYVIAHEITHAFDNNGSKFDENGNASDWWTEEDRAAFKQLCDKVIAFYDNREVAPGILSDGTLTLSENIADLGAVACITQVVSKLPNPNYEELYTSCSETFRDAYSRATRANLARTDVHSSGCLRGNLPLTSQEQFFKTFDIQPGDGMYVAPEDRVAIW